MTVLSISAQNAGAPPLSAEQAEASAHIHGPALALAVPGSGKTTLLLQRAHRLTRVLSLHPDQILTLTFSKAAATELAQRYQRWYPNHPIPAFSTLHAFAYRLLRRDAQQKGETAPKVITEFQQLQILQGLMLQHHISYSDEEELLGLRNELARYAGLGEPIPREADVRLQCLHDHYCAYKEAHALIDFEDMISQGEALLAQNLRLRQQLSRRYAFIQMDEAQDTSRLQHRLVRHLLTDDQNLFMVADDDQSIYAFRGADPDALLRFSADFPTGRLYRLSTNYRSTPAILEVCKHLIQHNQERYPKDLIPAQAADQQEIPRRLIFDTLSLRNQWLMDTLTDMPPEARRCGSVALLYRNNLSLMGIAQALVRADLPFYATDPCRGFFRHRVLADLRAWLDFAYIPNDFVHFQKNYYQLNYFFSKEIVAGLDTRCKDVPEALRRAYSGQWQYKNVQRLETQLQQLRALPPASALTFLLNDMGYGEYAAKRCARNKTPFAYVQSILDNLIAILEDSTHLAEAWTSLEHLEATLDNATREKDAFLYCGTLHSAKGMEFDHVYLLDVEADILPAPFAQSPHEKTKKTLRDLEEARHLAEERRLFYVGLSRARKTLTLPEIKFRSGARVSPSPFMAELGKTVDICPVRSPEVSTISSPSSGLREGELLHHAKFGEGRLLEQQGDQWTIAFADRTRVFSARVLLEKKLIASVQTASCPSD